MKAWDTKKPGGGEWLPAPAWKPERNATLQERFRFYRAAWKFDAMGAYRFAKYGYDTKQAGCRGVLPI